MPSISTRPSSPARGRARHSMLRTTPSRPTMRCTWSMATRLRRLRRAASNVRAVVGVQGRAPDLDRVGARRHRAAQQALEAVTHEHRAQAVGRLELHRQHDVVHRLHQRAQTALPFGARGRRPGGAPSRRRRCRRPGAVPAGSRRGRLRRATQRVAPSRPTRRCSRSAASPRATAARWRLQAARSSGCTAASHASGSASRATLPPSRPSSPGPTKTRVAAAVVQQLLREHDLGHGGEHRLQPPPRLLELGAGAALGRHVDDDAGRQDAAVAARASGVARSSTTRSCPSRPTSR